MVPHLREIVESAEYKAKAELNKPRKDRIVAFHWLEATIELEGKFFRVGVNMRTATNFIISMKTWTHGSKNTKLPITDPGNTPQGLRSFFRTLPRPSLPI